MDDAAAAAAAFGLQLDTEHAAQQLSNSAASQRAAYDRAPTFCLLPECLAAWQMWAGVQTQWRHGMDGPTGLDYAGVFAYLSAHGYGQGRGRRKSLAHMLEDIAAMERAHLQASAAVRAIAQARSS